MVESLKTGEVDGFCVGAPWNSAAVEQGLGRTLHFGCEVMMIHPPDGEGHRRPLGLD